MNPLIYLAAPFNHEDGEVRVDRVAKSLLCATNMMAKGYFVYSPLVYSNLSERIVHKFPDLVEMPESYWYEHGIRMLSKCDELWVLRLEGWEYSKGVAAEVKYAQQNGIPRRYIEQKEGAWHVGERHSA